MRAMPKNTLGTKIASSETRDTNMEAISEPNMEETQLEHFNKYGDWMLANKPRRGRPLTNTNPQNDQQIKHHS